MILEKRIPEVGDRIRVLECDNLYKNRLIGEVTCVNQKEECFYFKPDNDANDYFVSFSDEFEYL